MLILFTSGNGYRLLLGPAARCQKMFSQLDMCITIKKTDILTKIPTDCAKMYTNLIQVGIENGKMYSSVKESETDVHYKNHVLNSKEVIQREFKRSE